MINLLKSVLVVVIMTIFSNVFPAEMQAQVRSPLRIGRVKFSGGGDWYNDPSCEVNLLKFVREQTNIPTDPVFEPVDLNSDNVFSYPILFLTAHGNVNFSDNEVRRLRAYLEQGGFLYADDDYGMDASFRKEMKKVLPDKNFIELPFSHPIFSAHFSFPNGVPKTHEHDNKAPQTFGIFVNGRLSVVYTYESNPSDGWADPEVHRDPPEKRIEALRFGCNVIVYALSQQDIK